MLTLTVLLQTVVSFAPFAKLGAGLGAGIAVMEPVWHWKHWCQGTRIHCTSAGSCR